MADTPWTLGPWRNVGKSVMASGSTDTYSGSVLGQIAECYDTEEFDGEGRWWSCSGSAEANARLIAAAPEMAEALEAALEALHDAKKFSEFGGIRPSYTQRIDTIRSALAKARGEDQ